MRRPTQKSNLSAVEVTSLTIVTAYLDIGPVRKFKHVRRQGVYWRWSKIFGQLRNPLVVYTDSEYFLQLIKTHRSRFPGRTKFVMFDKSSSWAFSLNRTIGAIFQRTEYPTELRENPSNVNYSCVQHAKYEVTQKAAMENYFQTDYIAWLDVGLFRESVNNENEFTLVLPPGFNDSKIAVNQVNGANMYLDFWPIFKRKLVWICGCIFIGRIETVIRYTEQYKRSVNYFIQHHLMNTDEQVVYAMYTKQGRMQLKPDIDLQLYKKPKNYTRDRYFYTGYLMRQFS